MSDKKIYVKPAPVINKKESESLETLTKRYEKLTTPTKAARIGKKVVEAIPDSVKQAGKEFKDGITEAELFEKCMKIVADGFNVLEKQAARMTISEKSIVEKANATTKKNEITKLEEMCLVRGYNISKIASKYKSQDLLIALTEGGATGAFGFAGLPANLVLSIFIYYRAVQSIAMIYGYDVKNDDAEMLIASDVLMNALSPGSKGSDEISGIIGKIMIMTEATAIKNTAKKTWQDMAARGGVGLLIVQMRALANKSAQKALEKAGQKGLEESFFKGIFEQVGKKLTKKAVARAVPVVGAVIGGLFDTAQMNTIIEYADVFYNKRFLLEKEVRINLLIDGCKEDGGDEVFDLKPEDVVELDF